MKTQFNLNNLTDEEALYLENALATRRILKAHSSMIPIVDIGYKTCDIQLFTAFNPRGDSARGTMMPNFRQSGKSSMAHELLKPYLEFKYDYSELVQDQIDEEHEQYSAVFNQFRRGKYLPSIELKIGSLYELKLGSREVYTNEMYLVRIDGNIKHSPELYFSLNNENSSGTNISVYKIVREIK